MFGGHAQKSDCLQPRELTLMLQEDEFVTVLDLLEQWVRAKPDGASAEASRPRIFLILDCCYAGYCLPLPLSLRQRKDLVIQCAVEENQLAGDHVFVPMFVTLNLTYRACLRGDDTDATRMLRLCETQAAMSQTRIRAVHSPAVHRTLDGQLAEAWERDSVGRPSAGGAAPSSPMPSLAAEATSDVALSAQMAALAISSPVAAAAAAPVAADATFSFTPCVYVSWREPATPTAEGIEVTFPVDDGVPSEATLRFFPPHVYRRWFDSAVAADGDDSDEDTNVDMVGDDRRLDVTDSVTVDRVKYKYHEIHATDAVRALLIHRTKEAERNVARVAAMYSIEPNPHRSRQYLDKKGARGFYKALATTCAKTDVNRAGSLPSVFRTTRDGIAFTCTSQRLSTIDAEASPLSSPSGGGSHATKMPKKERAAAEKAERRAKDEADKQKRT